ncbi:YbaB/EbfC family nucleoid-associated protein [Streptomyces sp. TRM75561]|uniref:YbaB/EbfC family nucleoid-associated protein n=1 Tax=Streptomyces sp. TRM75561 TaxID=2975269 RepID=UPI00244C1058|nr:YbaB/EbfC family nucleoid-associated protein [Streptomyces sp. TRM75561]MDH3039083.1 YbaB/EbfC family nucleoid-associated protein [Streptomyces sp. TRM75561]
MELGNGLDIHKLLDSARRLREKVAQTQEELSRTGAQGTAGGGAVRASVDGKGVLVDLMISPVVADPSNVQSLADQVVAAVQEAQQALLDRYENRFLPVLDSIRAELGGPSS